jgi:hypothetical protein
MRIAVMGTGGTGGYFGGLLARSGEEVKFIKNFIFSPFQDSICFNYKCPEIVCF